MVECTKSHVKLQYKCPHCGWVFDANEQPDYDGKVPYHDWPVPCRQICPGAKQSPRDITDRRPSWSEEDKAVAEKVYAEIAESEREMEALLQRDIKLYKDVVQFDKSHCGEYDGMTLAQRIDAFRDSQSWVEYLGVMDTVNLTGNKQESDLGFECEYVDQFCNGGITGDDFAGHIYFPVGNDKWLKFYYAC